MSKRHRIQFPKSGVSRLNQDEAYFYLQGSGGQREIRFHDYDEIYQVQGLYQQVFYDRLKCTSPVKVATIESAVRQSQDNFTELRVLDLGAGNGMMGEELKKHGVSRSEREEISRGIAGGLSLRAIARQIERSPSTISRN
jgi:DNA-binding NarL/FixJ family response regulator